IIRGHPRIERSRSRGYLIGSASTCSPGRRAAWHQAGAQPSPRAGGRAARRTRRRRNAAWSGQAEGVEEPAIIRLAAMGGAAVGEEAGLVGIGAEGQVLE